MVWVQETERELRHLQQSQESFVIQYQESLKISSEYSFDLQFVSALSYIFLNSLSRLDALEMLAQTAVMDGGLIEGIFDCGEEPENVLESNSSFILIKWPDKMLCTVYFCSMINVLIWYTYRSSVGGI